MTSEWGTPQAQFGAAEKSDRNDTDDQHKGGSKGGILVEVGDALGKIREVAQGSRDRMLLYFIDMAIFQACESLCSKLSGMARKPSALLSDEADVG
jgi:hypothetical protein